MSYLPAAKRNRELNTLALSNKAPDVLDFELDVMFFGPRAHLDLLDRRGGRMALGVMGLFLLRVAGAQHANLAAVNVDYPDFRDANLVVHPYRRLARGRGTKISTNKSPPSA